MQASRQHGRFLVISSPPPPPPCDGAHHVHAPLAPLLLPRARLHAAAVVAAPPPDFSLLWEDLAEAGGFFEEALEPG